LRDDLALEPIAQHGGTVRVPGGPGLGIEVDRDVLRRFKVD
jgi:D-galactarolactone cycloisomerase